MHFNPHSREGSDHFRFLTIPRLHYFNPHSREGSDASSSGSTTVIFFISIHTPAKGVTTAICPVNASLIYFNPHSREGSDSESDAGLVIDLLFQSTLPRRE